MRERLSGRESEKLSSSLVPEQVTLQIPSSRPARKGPFVKKTPGGRESQSNLFPVAKPERGRVWKPAWNNSRSLACGRVC